MKKRLCIFDTDENYVLRLASALKKRCNNLFEIEEYTDREKFESQYSNSADIYLVNKNDSDTVNLEIKKTIYMVEERQNSYKDNEIYKYQNANDIYIEIIKRIEKFDDKISFDTKCMGNKLIIFFSPFDLPESTQRIFDICKERNAKTLYLNITCLPGVEEIANLDGGDVIELLYFSDTKKEFNKDLIKDNIHEVDGIDVLNCGTHTLEYSKILEGEWIDLINNLQNLLEYEYLIIECDAVLQGLTKILNMADELYCYIPNTGYYEFQKNRLIHVLKNMGEGSLIERMRFIND